MARLPWLVVLRVAALVALLGSSALTIDYLSPQPSFCGAQSGCAAVQYSGWGYLGEAGIPLPAVGLAGFTALFTLSLLPGARRLVAAPIAIAGGSIALGLLVVQAFVLRVFCTLCLIVDLAALVAAAAGVVIIRRREGEAREPLKDWAWAALAALAVVAPLMWPTVQPALPVPKAIAAYYVPGKLNVVEFVDFQCPFCRLLHPELKTVAAEYGARVNLVRLDLPLESHEHARGAAKAHVCASKRKQGDAMADVLFATEDLSHAGLLEAGKKVGIEPRELEACLAAPETEARVKETERILSDAGLLQGLPTTFIGARMLVGAQDAVTLRDAFERAATGRTGGIPGWLYIVLFALGAGAVLFFGRVREPHTPAPAPGRP